MMEVYSLWQQALAPVETVPDIMFSLVFQPLTKGILPKSQGSGGNLLGLTPDDGPLVITLLATVHSFPANDNDVVNAALGLVDKIDSVA